MEEALTDDTFATEMADILVDRGMPFRSAYRVVSKIATAAREKECSIKEIAKQADAQLLEPLTLEDIEGLSALQSVERRTATGGTAKKAVQEQLEEAWDIVELYKERLEIE